MKTLLALTLLIAIVTTAAQPNGSQCKPGKLTPFLTDTVFPAAGGPFAISQCPWYMAPENDARNLVFPAGTRFAPDTVVMLFGRTTDHIVIHEAGHVLDARHTAWQVMDTVERRGRNEYRRRDYFSADPTEYVAEAFARAVESGRHGFRDSTSIDAAFPGAIQYIRWLQHAAPFTQ